LNGVVETAGLVFACLAMYGGVRLQWSKAELFVKWKYVEICATLILFALNLFVAVFEWWLITLMFFLRQLWNTACVFVAWSFSIRLQAGEIYLATFGYVEGLANRSSVHMSTPGDNHSD
jgi:hypothetical protein